MDAQGVVVGQVEKTISTRRYLVDHNPESLVRHAVGLQEDQTYIS